MKVLLPPNQWTDIQPPEHFQTRNCIICECSVFVCFPTHQPNTTKQEQGADHKLSELVSTFLFFLFNITRVRSDTHS